MLPQKFGGKTDTTLVLQETNHAYISIYIYGYMIYDRLKQCQAYNRHLTN